MLISLGLLAVVPGSQSEGAPPGLGFASLALSGDPVVGQTLTVTAESQPAGAAVFYQWLRDGAPIPDASGVSLVLTAADDLAALSCRVRLVLGAEEVEAETGAVTVRRLAPVAGSLADVTFTQGTGPQTIDCAAGFTGGGLVFSTLSPHLVLDPATGLATVETAGLLAETPVTVTATNSGGTAEVTFRLAVVAVPAAQNIEPPALSGTPLVGQTLTVSTGTWVNADEFAYRWRRDGVLIAGATATAYTLVAADDQRLVTAEVRARPSGQAWSDWIGATGAVTVTWPAPVAGGSLPDLALATGEAMAVADLSAVFTGSNIAYALTPASQALPAGLALSPAGLLSGTPTEEAVRNIVVRASNSGGSAESGFSLTTAARPELVLTGWGGTWPNVSGTLTASMPATVRWIIYALAEDPGFASGTAAQAAFAANGGVARGSFEVTGSTSTPAIAATLANDAYAIHFWADAGGLLSAGVETRDFTVAVEASGPTPTVIERAGDGSTGTGFNITRLPLATSGDLLFCPIVVKGNPAISLSPERGWSLSAPVYSAAGDYTLVWAAKIATTTASNDTLSVSFNGASLYFRRRMYAIRGATLAVEAEGTAAGSFDPPSLSPTGGTKNYLAVAMAAGAFGDSVSAVPSGFGAASTFNAGNSSQVTLSLAEAAVSAALIDPGPFTGAGTTARAFTFAIHPPAV